MKNKRGFTLVELLAVIAILAILVIMALPAVLRMFNQARIDTFSNEINTILRTAKQQYLLEGGNAQTWTNADGSTNKLPLTGNSKLKYYVKMNGNGQITNIQVTNGEYQYSKSGIIEDVVKNDIKVVSELAEEDRIDGSGNESNITYVNRQKLDSITIGDEVAIESEHFYVISTNSDEITLLAKYNLYVGDIFNYDESASPKWSFVKSITSSDIGYGLQNETAKGYVIGNLKQYVGAVAFSGTNYWNNKVGSGKEYIGSYCASSSGTNCTYVYNSSMDTTLPTYTYNSVVQGIAQNNGYTIAYYVNEYSNRLKSMGAPTTIVGRLLKLEESETLNANIKNTCSYWLGSAYSNTQMWGVSSAGDTNHSSYYYDDYSQGLRPVIVIPTSEMPE